MKASRFWWFIRQICMAVERVFMFVGGIYIGTGDISFAGFLLTGSVVLHFIEHEAHFRCVRALTGEEVEEHGRKEK